MSITGLMVVAGCSPGDDESLESSMYLSLGDSLAVGVQPDEDGNVEETSQGYTDALYAQLRDRDSTLQHERMGCGGEDTTTMMTGELEHCTYDEGSQLDEAEAFLNEHEGRVELVTIGIGANNFTACVDIDEDADETEVGVDEACVDAGMDTLRAEMPEIAERLRAAAGDDVQIIGMTYYNPFLAAILLDEDDEEEMLANEAAEPATDEDLSDVPADPTGDSEQVAAYSIAVLEELNDELSAAYAANDIEVADVATAFDSDDFTVPPDSDTGMPTNVAALCDYTWMCNLDVGPDIHTNDAGAMEIAQVFEQQVR
ncbi:GDSL-type esterase/lipase family protein, partial [Lipingzhangella sp. LS1_29]|nr:GDSL-type esterase/lipase family protein [Lipingzhangella rawalii]